MERRRVVITGLGAVTPIGLTAGESWQAVKNGVCGIGPITHYDPAAQKVKLAAEVKGFDPEALLGRQDPSVWPFHPVRRGGGPGGPVRAPGSPRSRQTRTAAA